MNWGKFQGGETFNFPLAYSTFVNASIFIYGTQDNNTNGQIWVNSYFTLTYIVARIEGSNNYNIGPYRSVITIGI